MPAVEQRIESETFTGAENSTYLPIEAAPDDDFPCPQ
jgi:hypothetical protein